MDQQNWQYRLSPEQFAVLRQKATEAPFSGEYLYTDAAGVYSCAGCGTQLFDSASKFEADCGWPSFYDAKSGAVKLSQDNSHGMNRIEVSCATCGGHLGHVFDDAPDQPTDQRYCINSLALDFSDSKKA